MDGSNRITRRTSQPVPTATATAAQLRALTQRVLDAMIRNSPYELPLADAVRYTENCLTVTPGEGLWKSLDGLREWGNSVTDAVSGQAGWVGSLDEFGLFCAAGAAHPDRGRPDQRDRGGDPAPERH